MNQRNRSFLIALGLFWLLTSTLMLMTGFWPDLREFGFSEGFFMALAYLGVVAGVLAVLTGVFAGRQKSLE